MLSFTLNKKTKKKLEFYLNFNDNKNVFEKRYVQSLVFIKEHIKPFLLIHKTKKS